MSTFRKLLWSIAILAWIANMVILIIALTDVVPSNPFKQYSFVIGLGLVTITGLMRIEYRRQNK
ncbi:hypothetical protein [uncultured Acetobacteroides sp.]|uniref:hypothetical protein n=1 Tax=uncultured Acetobacteroides sp. TaxID=1760811 RepID=UPI0029F545E2|nr:hypothetical protein [uncultured Acetobacteroides sp.]